MPSSPHHTGRRDAQRFVPLLVFVLTVVVHANGEAPPIPDLDALSRELGNALGVDALPGNFAVPPLPDAAEVAQGRDGQEVPVLPEQVGDLFGPQPDAPPAFFQLPGEVQLFGKDDEDVAQADWNGKLPVLDVPSDAPGLGDVPEDDPLLLALGKAAGFDTPSPPAELPKDASTEVPPPADGHVPDAKFLERLDHLPQDAISHMNTEELAAELGVDLDDAERRPASPLGADSADGLARINWEKILVDTTAPPKVGTNDASDAAELNQVMFKENEEKEAMELLHRLEGLPDVEYMTGETSYQAEVEPEIAVTRKTSDKDNTVFILPANNKPFTSTGGDLHAALSTNTAAGAPAPPVLSADLPPPPDLSFDGIHGPRAELLNSESLELDVTNADLMKTLGRDSPLVKMFPEIVSPEEVPKVEQPREQPAPPQEQPIAPPQPTVEEQPKVQQEQPFQSSPTLAALEDDDEPDDDELDAGDSSDASDEGQGYPDDLPEESDDSFDDTPDDSPDDTPDDSPDDTPDDGRFPPIPPVYIPPPLAQTPPKQEAPVFPPADPWKPVAQTQQEADQRPPQPLPYTYNPYSDRAPLDTATRSTPVSSPPEFTMPADDMEPPSETEKTVRSILYLFMFGLFMSGLIYGAYRLLDAENDRQEELSRSQVSASARKAELELHALRSKSDRKRMKLDAKKN